MAASCIPAQSYTYKQSRRGSGYTTYLIQKETVGSDSYAYTYDEAGNITQIRDGDGTLLQKYTYDGFGQLVKEEDAQNGHTVTYSYDNGGNLKSRTADGVTTTYGYGDAGWKDLLTSYNGQAMNYQRL